MPPFRSTERIPASAGVGLRLPHVDALLDGQADAVWVEIHAENYMAAGGPRRRALESIRNDRPVSVHGVGLSLGSAAGVDERHLARLEAVVRWIEPGLVSEHVAWSVDSGTYLNDLLPIPYTEESLDVVCRNVGRVQEALGRPILMENPSAYLRFVDTVIPEAEFLAEMVRRTGCRLLVDVNNLHVSAANVGTDPAAWLDAVPAAAVGEIHVAGHFVDESAGGRLLIDDHGAPVAAPVWELLGAALRRFGPVPVLVEWDNRIPPLPVLLGEAAAAERMIAAAALERCDAA